MEIQYAEEKVYEAVLKGYLEIDKQGRVWRTRINQWNPKKNSYIVVNIKKRRAENKTKEYLQVRIMDKKVRVSANAHRLVWKHFFGRIPEGLTVNHKNGIKTDNRPRNLELATFSEQALHARRVLGKCHQSGETHPNAKLTTADIQDIRKRRQAGEPARSIADDHEIHRETVYKISSGRSRRFDG